LGRGHLKTLLRALAGLFAVGAALAIVAALAIGWLVHAFGAPGPSTDETIVEVPSGAGLSDIAERLAAAEVIDDERVFTYGTPSPRPSARAARWRC
jgi:cell division protein YceG involved in septum cleavage